MDHVDNWRWPKDRSNVINLMTVESLVSDLNLNFENYIVVNKRGGCDMTLYFKEVGRVWRRRDSRALIGFQHFLVSLYFLPRESTWFNIDINKLEDRKIEKNTTSSIFANTWCVLNQIKLVAETK